MGEKKVKLIKLRLPARGRRALLFAQGMFSWLEYARLRERYNPEFNLLGIDEQGPGHFLFTFEVASGVTTELLTHVAEVVLTQDSDDEKDEDRWVCHLARYWYYYQPHQSRKQEAKVYCVTWSGARFAQLAHVMGIHPGLFDHPQVELVHGMDRLKEADRPAEFMPMMEVAEPHSLMRIRLNPNATI